MDILDVEKNVIPLAYHSIQLLMNYELDMPEDVMNIGLVGFPATAELRVG